VKNHQRSQSSVVGCGYKDVLDVLSEQTVRTTYPFFKSGFEIYKA